jgi:tetratricopeptide (TPR) repeat protein
MAQYETKQAAADLAVNPSNADAHYRLGLRLLDAGQPEQAQVHLTAALKLRPDLEAAWYPRALAAFRLKRWDDAVADAGRYLNKYPFDIPARRLRAEVHRIGKRYEEAAADYTSLIATYPSHSLFYQWRGDCYEALGKRDLAKADREKVLQFGAQSATTLNNQAWRLVAGPEGDRDPTRALELIQAAIKHQPENATFLNTLGVVQYRNGQYKEALASLEKSLAARQGHQDGFDLFFLAMCHAQLGDMPKARACQDRAVRWCQERDGSLSGEQREAFRSFRAEAETLLKPP